MEVANVRYTHDELSFFGAIAGAERTDSDSPSRLQGRNGVLHDNVRRRRSSSFRRVVIGILSTVWRIAKIPAHLWWIFTPPDRARRPDSSGFRFESRSSVRSYDLRSRVSDNRVLTRRIYCRIGASKGWPARPCNPILPGRNSAGEEVTIEVTARLFKTSGGKFVVGVEKYDRTNEQYKCRHAEAHISLDELVALICERTHVDDDILGELFEGTAIADRFVEQID